MSNIYSNSSGFMHRSSICYGEEKLMAYNSSKGVFRNFRIVVFSCPLKTQRNILQDISMPNMVFRTDE